MRRVILAIVSTTAALVLILSYKTHGTASLATPPAAISSSSGTAATGSAGSTGSTSTTGTTTATTKTVTGDAMDTRFGPVQVRITVANGKITAASAINYPTGSPRDAEINAYAIPQLNQEAVQASSANIDMVSGATFTSQGYIQSLQSALDKAKA